MAHIYDLSLPVREGRKQRHPRISVTCPSEMSLKISRLLPRWAEMACIIA